MSMDTQYGPPVDSGAVDPNSPPPDPMLQQEPDLTQHDEPANPYMAGEASTRDRVELCCLTAIEQLANACKVGTGAENMDFAVKAGQAAASFGQAYAALASVELKEANGKVADLQGQLDRVLSFTPSQPTTPSQGA